jgi:hypothetical protein
MVASELGLQLSQDLEPKKLHTYTHTNKQTNKQIGVMCEINNNNNNCKNLRGPYLLPLS